MIAWLSQAKKIHAAYPANYYFCPRLMKCYDDEFCYLFAMDDQGFQCLYRDELILALLFAKEIIK